ncbi:MAG: hypothetical protein IT583_06735 [Verrucomicrobia bacterium]|nr:hypothetical protein [Verrucomicrobiota bacterium]
MKSNSPEPEPIRSAGHFPHILRLTGFALSLAILLILFALLVIGLPPSLTRSITAQVRAAGIPIQVESIRLSTHRGWVLKNVSLYSNSPDDLQPLLTTKKLYVMIWPVNWKHPAGGSWHIKLYAKKLGASLGQPWESVLPESHPFRQIKQLDASLIAAPGKVSVEKATLDWGGINILIRGNADFSAASSNETPQGQDFRRRAARAADALSYLKCAKPPQLQLDFLYNNAQPEETFLNATLSAEKITWRNRLYKRLDGSLGYRDGIWTIASLQLSHSENERILLHGSANINSSNAQLSVENTLSAADLFNLLPEEAQSAVAQTGIKPGEKIDFTASVGPAPFDQLAEKTDVQIQMAQFTRHDITLDPLALHLIRTGNRIEVRDLRARVNGGTLTGSFDLDLASEAWTARIQAQCKPSIAGAYDDDLRDFISRFRFPAEQPKADLTISQSGPDASIVMSGSLSGDNFTCGGVPIDHLETFMVFSNRVVDLTPIHAVRGKEKFDGSVQVDFNRQIGIFSATNSFPPGDISQALAPDEDTVLSLFRFDGPVYASGQGQIDYGTWTNHLFKGTFRAENISMDKLKVSSFNADVEVRGTQLIFTNVAAGLYNGTAEGHGEFDILLEDGSAPYHINARFNQLDLAQMLKQTSEGDYGRTRGQLSTAFDLTADAKTNFWQSAKGRGQVEIKNGYLADVPFFGGFSRLVQSAFSSFNLFALTSFSADYELRDGALRSDNAQLGGTLVSARGRGSYSPESGLNFVVTAEPLRQTTGGADKERSQLQRLAANALKETTAPILRLLEFRLEGPLDKPEWRFVNLPK